MAEDEGVQRAMQAQSISLYYDVFEWDVRRSFRHQNRTIRPRDHAHPEYVVILKFDRYDHLKTWLESDVRRDWIERLQPLIEKPETIQTLTGLETWFSLPNQLLKAPPPRYKMALVTWLGVFVTLPVLQKIGVKNKSVYVQNEPL